MNVGLEKPSTFEAGRFELVLIKPSHYDGDGYVIQWFKSSIPSNTLAALYGLADEAAKRNVLGPDVEIVITPIDETNMRVSVPDIIKRIEAAGGHGMVGLVGVQSNQFPRALDIARPLRAAGIQVVIGGFHVSGCLAMLPGMQPDLQKALDMGITLYAGEAEDRLDEVLLDAAARRLKPIYNYMSDLPGIGETPIPFLPSEMIRGNIGGLASFDAGRGCPYQCSFCTIINVQGRKSRSRSPDDVERIIRENLAQGIRHFFITDDNFARNKDWEIILDRIIAIREGMTRHKPRFVIQVDTLCHRNPNFIEKCGRAGVASVFIGLENINPANLLAAKKRQNKIDEYREMLLAWKAQRVVTYAGYILGFPNDTRESILHDIEIIKRELPIDLLEFFCLTPLPGSEDHKKLSAQGVAMDPDMNKYDLEHVVTAHPKMSQAEWEGIYREAWRAYYTPQHLQTLLRRAIACRINSTKVLSLFLYFRACVLYEHVHPLEGGLFRLKFRRDRRHGMALEPAWIFYPKYLAEFAVKSLKTAGLWARFYPQLRLLRKLGGAKNYADTALAPVSASEAEVSELLTQSEAARAAVAHQRKIRELTAGA
ncbi:B12-binding domain-containing radical SAM protein [Methylovirgula sp. 4M-Z18]|uniref:B12-binding domain-containing radical SAM protein n=1 Tax=Methylovirgula sp. 4M-Z18 TaxID=2293567 RepID=UPI000E2E8560|nr:B12-binding domain-containing radical SAM protein [Methylovirgula sp. 4M-Z18]RFB75050.1 radical SAM protein [Methylovirgula sp. 4M-Z18]